MNSPRDSFVDSRQQIFPSIPSPLPPHLRLFGHSKPKQQQQQQQNNKTTVCDYPQTLLTILNWHLSRRNERMTFLHLCCCISANELNWLMACNLDIVYIVSILLIVSCVCLFVCYCCSYNHMWKMVDPVSTNQPNHYNKQSNILATKKKERKEKKRKKNNKISKFRWRFFLNFIFFFFFDIVSRMFFFFCE